MRLETRSAPSDRGLRRFFGGSAAFCTPVDHSEELARRVAQLALVERSLSTEGVTPTAHYAVTGALFFASSNDMMMQFESADDPERIVTEMSGSHIWDASTVATLDAIKYRYERHGKHVVIEGLNEASTILHTRLAGTMGFDR